LKREDILQRQKKAVSEVTSILGLNDDEAIRVLRKFKWCAAVLWGCLQGRCSRSQQQCTLSALCRV